jgi:CubicO group peptidase (beta-lactamase class C family)
MIACTAEMGRSTEPRQVSRARGIVAPGYEEVAEAFTANFERGEVGAAFAAYVDGEPVVDIWGGLADSGRGVEWREDTLIGVFSGTKGMVAVCLLLLIERGQIELEVPVCRYWPEFAAAGKEGILVRDVVCHQAGLPGLTTPVSAEEATDYVRMAALLAAQPSIREPQEGPIYHAMTFGWLCGELIRRVDGRSVGRFFAEEVAAPLGLEIWIGLPERLEPRVAVLELSAGFGELGSLVERDIDPVGWSIWANPPRYHDLAHNDRRWHAAEIPATSGIAAARSLARLYGCLANGGEIDGVRLLAEETIERGRRRLSVGRDPYLGEIAFATAFELQADPTGTTLPPDEFGHSGAGGSVHGAWPSLRTGFSYSQNMLHTLDGLDPRAEALLVALHAAARRAHAKRRNQGLRSSFERDGQSCDR